MLAIKSSLHFETCKISTTLMKLVGEVGIVVPFIIKSISSFAIVMWTIQFGATSHKASAISLTWRGLDIRIDRLKISFFKVVNVFFFFSTGAKVVPLKF